MAHKKYIYGGILASILFLSFVGAITLFKSDDVIKDLNSMDINEKSGIRGHVDVLVNRWDKEREEYEGQKLWYSSPNVIYTDGLNMLKEILGSDTDIEPILNISLCNASADCGTPVAAQSETFTKYTNCGMEGGNHGTYGSLGNGNWSVFKTFTNSCGTLNTTSTKISSSKTQRNLSSNTFTLVSLETNDQVTINWTLTVEAA